MSEPICKNCIHYHQHYILNNDGFLGVYCGHCTLHSVRRKVPHKPACPEFEQGADVRERFPSQKYVTKALLAYLLSLEFLPDIGEDFSVPK